MAARLTGHWAFWVVVLLTAVSLPLARSFTRELPPAPPVYGKLESFQLTDQDGAPFGLADLEGRVWVANFMFTSCAEVCPRLTSRMREVQDRVVNMGDIIHLVSISVDPARDTPEKLREYAARFSARPGQWSFLSGPLDAIERTVVDGFKIAMEHTEVDDTGFFDIVHGERFVLVDQLGQIRGYYHADDEGIQQLLNELGLLANLGPRSPGAGDSVVSLRRAAS